MTLHNDALKNALQWQDLAAVKSIAGKIARNRSFDEWPFHRFCENREILDELAKRDCLHGLWDSHACYNCAIDNKKFRAWFLKGPFLQMIKNGSQVFKIRLLSDIQREYVYKSVTEMFNAYAFINQFDHHNAMEILLGAVKLYQIHIIKLILKNQHFEPLPFRFQSHFFKDQIADDFLAFIGKCKSQCNKIAALRAGKRLVTKDMVNFCIAISALNLPVLLQSFLLESCLEPFSFCTPYGWFDCIAQLVTKSQC